VGQPTAPTNSGLLFRPDRAAAKIIGDGTAMAEPAKNCRPTRVQANIIQGGGVLARMEFDRRTKKGGLSDWDSDGLRGPSFEGASIDAKPEKSRAGFREKEKFSAYPPAVILRLPPEWRARKDGADGVATSHPSGSPKREASQTSRMTGGR